MKRWCFFVYGVSAHLLFLAVYAGFAGFVGNLLPRSIDTPAALPPGWALAVNLGLLALFGLQHSVMARPAFKRWWTKFIPPPVERSTYVLASNAAVLVLLGLWQGMGGVVWDVREPVTRGVLWSLFLAGWLMVPAVSLMINHFDLFGTRQVWLYLRGRPYEPLPFRTPLLYSRVRHPLYLGWALAFWATPTMTTGHLLFAAAMTLYLAAAAVVEERDLASHFGDAYRTYQQRVPMFVPRVVNAAVLTDPSWWHWALTIPLLAAHLFGVRWAIAAALALCAGMGAYYLVRLRRVRPFPVQLRLAYLGWLLIGWLPGMQWMHYVALIGTTAMVLVGYCPLARVLSLLPFNRTEPLTPALVRRTVLAPPAGGLFRWDAGADVAPPATCSLRAVGVDRRPGAQPWLGQTSV